MSTSPVDFLVEIASEAIGYLSTVENGRVFLSHGRYEYKFATKRTPMTVSLTEVDSGVVPACGGGGIVNTFGVRLVPDGFILVADVTSDASEILWQASLEPTQSN